MKIYYHAGLKQLAQVSGYRAETLTTLENCSNFSRTHQFLLQVWQAMFQSLMVSFGAGNTDHLPHFNVEDTEVHSTLKETLAILQNNEIYEKFKVHASKLCEQDTTIMFWYRFIFCDCFCYIQLYIAIRCQNWNLRNSALKLMAPLFSAYDRTTYQRLIPYHLVDLKKFPQCIINQLEKALLFQLMVEKGMQSPLMKPMKCA